MPQEVIIPVYAISFCRPTLQLGLRNTRQLGPGLLHHLTELPIDIPIYVCIPGSKQRAIATLLPRPRSSSLLVESLTRLPSRRIKGLLSHILNIESLPATVLEGQSWRASTGYVWRRHSAVALVRRLLVG